MTGTDGSDEDLERRRLPARSQISRETAGKSVRKDAQSPSSKVLLGSAIKLSSEFVAAILVGVGIGWVLDYWAGTSPWGLIVFLFSALRRASST